MNTRLFVMLARNIHGNSYNYSKTVYDRSYIQVCVTCRSHGDYYTLPSAHLRGTICGKCYNKSNLEKVMNYYQTNIKKYN